MNEFRERWPDRRGFIFAVIGVSMGLGIAHQIPLAANGVQLLIWLIAMVSLVLPTLVLELAMGMIYQGALSESLRKSDKRLEAIGWFACGAAFCALILAGATAGDLVSSGFTCFLSTLANQPLPWAPQLVPGPDAPQVVTSSPVAWALAIVMVLLYLRLWRGAPSIARTAVLTVPCGLIALVILFVAMILRPGALDGLARWLSPDERGWNALLDWHAWCSTYAYALSTWMVGLGIYAAFGSYLNRSSDITGLAGVSVLGAGLGQMLLMMVVAAADGLTWNEIPATGLTRDATWPMVPNAIVSLGLPRWGQALLATVWFLGLLCLALPALLALAEAVVAPIADKFRIPRERVVAGVCMAAFFCAALADLPHDHLWTMSSDATVLIGTGLLVFLLAIAAWKRTDLDAMQRHLNAYSAIRVGVVWRMLVRWLVPIAALVVAAQRLVQQLSAHVTETSWLASGMPFQIGIAMLVLLAVSSFVIARVPGRGA